MNVEQHGTRDRFLPKAPGAGRPDASADLDDLLGRYGAHLHALAYHLCGDAVEAGRLAREALVRQCLRLGADQDRSEAPIRLYLGLIGLWRETRRRRGLWARRSGGNGADTCDGSGAAGRPAGSSPGRAGPLHRALIGLDRDQRVVLVLRVGEGLDYEEIAAILRLPAETVRSRLQAGRSRVQARLTKARCPRQLEKAMNLFLDERLGGPDRLAFERHMETDASLRESVEFHRGLTLEFAEEAPPPPRDFPDLVREAFERRAAAPGADAAGRLSPGASRRVMAVVAVMVAGTILALGLYLALRGQPGPPPVPDAASGEGVAGEPDEQTREALRSLGYLAAGPKPTVKRGETEAAPAQSAAATGSRPAADARPQVTPVPAKGAEPAAESPVKPGPAGGPVAADAAPAPATGVAAEAGPLPEAAPEEPSAGRQTAPDQEGGDGAEATEGVAFRVVGVPRGPDLGRDNLVFRTADDWAAFLAPTGAPAPEVGFPGEMVVVVRHLLQSDPPSRLAVIGVRVSDGALVIECRVERGEAPADAPPAPGQAIVLPAGDRPIRVVVR